MTDATRITAKSWMMVALLGLTWGATFMVIELALVGITPFWLAAGRIGFAALLMLIVWAALGFRLFRGPVQPGNWAALTAVGALSSALPFMLISWGQTHVTSGFAGVSMASVALIVLPLAHIFVPGEQLTLRRAIGFVIGFVGVCILIGGRAFESSGAQFESLGRLACISAAACYAVSSILMRRLPAVDPIGLSTLLLCIGTALVLPVAWLAEGPPPMPAPDILMIIVILGLIPTAAANLLRVLVIRSAGPVFMSLTNYQVPVWSVVLGALILSEPLPPSLIGALILILAGVGLSQYGALHRLFVGAK